MRTTLSELDVASKGRLGWGTLCHDRDIDGWVSVARGVIVNCIVANECEMECVGGRVYGSWTWYDEKVVVKLFQA